MKTYQEFITESYESRISDFSNYVVSGTKNGDSLLKTIEVSARIYKDHFLELQLDGKAKKDFLKDVVDYIKKNKLISRAPRASSYKKFETEFESKDDYQRFLREVYQITISEVGSVFPDGDPIDSIFPKIRKIKKIPSYFLMDVVDEALKLFEKQSYNKYISNFWSDVVRDMDDGEKKRMFGTTTPNNPWK